MLPKYKNGSIWVSQMTDTEIQKKINFSNRQKHHTSKIIQSPKKDRKKINFVFKNVLYTPQSPKKKSTFQIDRNITHPKSKTKSKKDQLFIQKRAVNTPKSKKNQLCIRKKTKRRVVATTIKIQKNINFTDAPGKQHNRQIGLRQRPE